MIDNFITKDATGIFLTNGYKTVTMDEVASTLGVSKKTLYEIYGNKEGLIRASLEYQFLELRDIFREATEENLDALSEINLIMNKIRTKFNTAQHKNAVYQLQKYYSKIYKKIYLEQLGFVKTSIVKNIEKGQASGLYRTNINPNDLAEILIQVQNYLKNSEHNLRDYQKMECLSNMHFDLMLRGMLTSKGLDSYNKLEIDKQ